jgi:hypothetical protein
MRKDGYLQEVGSQRRYISDVVVLPPFSVLLKKTKSVLMVFHTLGTYVKSFLIGLARRNISDAPRNVEVDQNTSTEDVPRLEHERYSATGEVDFNHADSYISPTVPERIFKPQDIRMVLARQKYTGLPDIVRSYLQSRLRY